MPRGRGGGKQQGPRAPAAAPACAEHPESGAGDRQEEALPVRRVQRKGPHPSYPFAIPEALCGPKDAELGTRLWGLCDREAELGKEGPHQAQPTAPMPPMSIGEYDRPQRDGLQRATIEEQQVRMGDQRGLCILTIRGPDEVWALFPQHAMVRATAHPG